MKNPWAHRCAILLAAFSLLVIAFGASLTSEIRHLPGVETPVQPAPALEQLHRVSGYAVVVLTIGVALWASCLPGWLAAAAAILEIFLGGVPMIHALLAPVLFALIAGVVLVTSPSWAAPAQVENAWKPLGPLSLAVPVLVAMQIGLGAAFRHNAMGVVSHIMNAVVVLGVIFTAGIFVLRQYPEHQALKNSALGMLIVGGIQVLLGFAVYLVLLMASENNIGVVVTGVVHVVNGSLTLAASLIFYMQVQRNIRSLTGL